MADTKPPASSSILHVRTYADDLKRAESGQKTPPDNTAMHVSVPVIPMPKHHTHAQEKTGAEKLQEELSRHAAPLKEHQESVHTPPASSAAQSITEGAFDIREAARTATDDATIIEERTITRPSVWEEIAHNISTWWRENVESFLASKGDHADIHMDVAPSAQVPAWSKENLKAVPPIHTFATDADAVARGLRPATPPAPPSTWKRVSEPRSETSIPHTTDDELAAYRAKLRTLPPRPQNEERKPFKTPRALRAPISASGNFIAKDTDATVAPEVTARERLERLAQSPKEQQNEEKKVSREIPFIPPKLSGDTLSAPIRTYRHDALSDIKTRQLSTEKIATEEATRRERGGVSMPVRPPTHHETQRTRWLLPVFGSVVGICIIAFGGYAAFTYLAQTREVTPLVQGIPAFFTTSIQVVVLASEDRTTLLSALNDARAEVSLAPAETALLYPQREGTDSALKTTEVMGVLDPRAPGAFVRGLHDIIMFGAYGERNEPFLVLRADTIQNGIAGMRAWESYLSVDLAPFFGSPVRRSYDQNALTVDQTRAAYFADTIMHNKDVRVLYDEFGTERILYTFVNTTIIIARDSATLLALIDLIE